MKPPGSNMTSFLGRPASIARLFSLDEKGDALWAPEEMQAMWRHQLSASLQTELSGGTSLPAGAPRNQGTVNLAGSPKSTKSDASLSPKTFGELFTATQPS